MRLFHAGIYEYDKRPVQTAVACEVCGSRSFRSRLCKPCRGEKIIIANRVRRKAQTERARLARQAV